MAGLPRFRNILCRVPKTHHTGILPPLFHFASNDLCLYELATWYASVTLTSILIVTSILILTPTSTAAILPRSLDFGAVLGSPPAPCLIAHRGSASCDSARGFF